MKGDGRSRARRYSGKQCGFGIFEDFLTFDLGKAYDMFEVNILGMMV